MFSPSPFSDFDYPDPVIALDHYFFKQELFSGSWSVDLELCRHIALCFWQFFQCCQVFVASHHDQPECLHLPTLLQLGNLFQFKYLLCLGEMWDGGSVELSELRACVWIRAGMWIHSDYVEHYSTPKSGAASKYCKSQMKMKSGNVETKLSGKWCLVLTSSALSNSEPKWNKFQQDRISSVTFLWLPSPRRQLINMNILLLGEELNARFPWCTIRAVTVVLSFPLCAGSDPETSCVTDW